MREWGEVTRLVDTEADLFLAKLEALHEIEHAKDGMCPHARANAQVLVAYRGTLDGSPVYAVGWHAYCESLRDEETNGD